MRDQRQHILNEIARIAKERGETPGRMVFERMTGIKDSAWRGVFWARWSDAIKEAGLETNEYQQRATKTRMLSKLAAATRHYGRIPVFAELKLYRQVDPDFPSDKTFSGHFRAGEFAERLHDWINETPGNEDLLSILPPRGAEDAPNGRAGKRVEGLVYLIRSGGHFKIGRSEEVERRVKQIRIQLPEAATLEHTISTDDPSGIEAYWHRRFADRRANGEWFKLTASDVAAFKRRKYQ